MSLFENLDIIHDMQRTASRQAVTMAARRADLRFGEFLRTASSKDELEARKTLIADDLRSLISATCAEFDYNDTESVLASVESSLGLVHEARRPKMCPFHREVTDISLSTGDPNAGFNAMSQHSFGESSCRGNWEGSCNWKPEMVKQEYWDKRNEELDQRRQEREQQNMQIQPQGLPENSAIPSPEGDELMKDLTDYQGVDLENALDGAPSAVGGGDLSELGGQESGDISFDSGPQNTQIVPFLSSTHEANQYVEKRGDKWVVTQKGSGKTLSTHDSKEDAEASFRAMEMGKHSSSTHQAELPQGLPGLPPGGVPPASPAGALTNGWLFPPNPNPGGPVPGSLEWHLQGQEELRKYQEARDAGLPTSFTNSGVQAALHKAEGPRGTSVVTGDSVEKNESPDMKSNPDESYASGFGREPTVKLDKDTWNPENLKPIDTDSGTRHPSELQDINQAADYQGNPFEDDGRFDKTQNLVAQEQLPSAGFDDGGLNRDITVTPNSDTRTWDKDFGGDSAVLKQQNPVTPQTLSHFLSSDQIDRAIRDFNS